MRMIVFFDLSTITSEDRQNYRNFRKLLTTNGFIMLQESIYCKLMTTPTVEKSITMLLQKNKPPQGVIQTLMITEKQFSNIKCIAGSFETDVLASDERVVVL